mgnify:CR=1 FL=1
MCQAASAMQAFAALVVPGLLNQFFVLRSAALTQGVGSVSLLKNFAMIGSRLREGIGVEHRKDTPGFSGW